MIAARAVIVRSHLCKLCACLAVAATLGVLAAGCGTSSGPPGSISLMVSYPAANVVQNFPEIATGAQAAASAINRSGGIDGHQIHMIACNNKDDPNDAQTCGREAVADHVVSLVGQADLYSSQSLPILQEAKIPSVGLFTVDNPQDQTSPMSFMFNAGSVGSFLGAPFLLAQHHISSVAEAVSSAPVAASQAALIVPLLKQAGIAFKGAVTIPLSGVTDYSPYAAQLKNTGAQAIIGVISTPLVDGLVKATSAIGYNPFLVLDSQVVGETDVAQAPGVASHLVISSPYPSPRDTSSPLIRQFIAESAAYAHKSPAQYLASTRFGGGWSNAVDAWLSVHAVAKAFALAPHGSALSSATLLKVLDDRSTKIDLYGQPWIPAYDNAHDKYYPRVNTLPLYYLNFLDGKLHTVSPRPINVRSKTG